MVELWTFDLISVFEPIHPAHSQQNLDFCDYSGPITTCNWILAASSSIIHAAKCTVYLCASLTHGMPRLALQETISRFFFYLYFVCTRASSDVMLARTYRIHFRFAAFYFKMARSLEVSTEIRTLQNFVARNIGRENVWSPSEVKPTDKQPFSFPRNGYSFSLLTDYRPSCVRLAAVLEDTFDDEGYSEAASSDIR